MTAPQAFHDAVIWHESRGRNVQGPVITAGANKGDRAQGASQVMPLTLRDPGFGVTPARDNSPEEVERVGREYRDAMTARYNGDLEAAAIAYNAGPGNADKWLAAGRDYAVLPQREQTEPYAKGIVAMAAASESPVFQQRPTEKEANEVVETLVPDTPESDEDEVRNTDMLTGKQIVDDYTSGFLGVGTDYETVTDGMLGPLYSGQAEIANGFLPKGVLPEFAPGNLGESFITGADQGLQGMQAEFQKAGAAFNTLIGETETANRFMENSKLTSQAASAGLMNVETFGEFLAEPTLDGFLKQAASGTGQALPSILTTIGGALFSGGGSVLVQIFGRKFASKASKEITRQLLREAIQKRARGEALKKGDKQILNASYYAFRRGAAAGAFGSEYPIMVGSSFGEFDEAGVELNANRALQSIGIGVPLAAVGVGGEAVLAKGFINAARRKAAGDSNSIFARYARELGKSTAKGAAIEGTTEGVQEGGLVAQRFAVDSDYSSEEAQLRIAQGVFIGALAGAGVGGGGSILSTTANIIGQGPSKLIEEGKKALPDDVRDQIESDVPVEGLDDKPVTRKLAKGLIAAARMIDRTFESKESTEARAARLGISDDQYAGVPTAEPTEYLQAQMAALLDPDSPKRGVLYPRRSKAMEAVQENEATATQEGEVRELRIGEFSLFTVLTPQGLVFTRSQQDAEALLNDPSEANLGSVLGFSSEKPEGANRVVRVRDKQSGGIVSEQLVNEQTEGEAVVAAQSYPQENYEVDTVPLEQALEERREAFRRSQNEATTSPEDAQAEAEAELVARNASGGAEGSLNESTFDPGGSREHVNRLKRTDPRFRDPDYEQKWNTFLSSIPEDERAYYNERKTMISDSLLRQMQAMVDERFDGDSERPSLYMPRIESAKDSDGFVDFYREPTAPDSAKAREVNDLRKRLLTTARVDVNTKRSKKLRTPIQVTFEGKKGERTVNPDLRTMINIARKMNIAEDTAVLGEGITPRQSAAMAFQRVWIELSNAGYKMELQGVPVLAADPKANGKLFETKTVPITFSKKDFRTHPQMAGVVVYNSSTVNMTYQEIFSEAQPRPYETVMAEERFEARVLDGRRAFKRAVAKVKKDYLPALRAATRTNGTESEQIVAEIRAELERIREDYEARYEALIADSWGHSRDNALIEDSENSIDDPEKIADDQINKSGARRAERAEQYDRKSDAELALEAEIRKDNARRARRREAAKNRDDRSDEASVEAIAERELEDVRADEREVLNQELDELEGPQDPVRRVILGPEEEFDTAPTIFSRMINEDYVGWKADQDYNNVEVVKGKTQSTPKVASFKFVGPALAEAGSRVMSIAKGAFKFSKPVAVIRATELNGKKIDQYIGDGKLFPESARDYVMQWVDELVKSGDRAQMVPGKSGYFIVINDIDPPSFAKTDEEIDAAYGLALAHEIGHIHFIESKREILADNSLREKMWNAFIDTIQRMEADGLKPTQYTEDVHGFEEWFSDQVAAYALEQFTNKKKNSDLKDRKKIVFKKNGVVQTTYRANDPAIIRRLQDMVQRLRTFVKRLHNIIGKRYELYSSENFSFEKYVEDVKKREKAQRNPAITDVEDMRIRSQNEALAENQTNVARAKRVARTAKKMFSHSSMGWLKRHVYAADDWLRSLGDGGKELAQWFYGKSQSEESQGYHQRKNHAHNRMVNQILDVLDAHDMSREQAFEENESALLDAADETIPTAQLTGVARALRDLLQSWYTEYVGPELAGTEAEISFRENYFPRQFDEAAISEDRDGFIAFLSKYIDAKAAEGVADTILDTVDPEDDPVGNPAFRNSLQRTLEQVPTREIINAGYAVSPLETLLSYTHHAAKRVEYERGGGRDAMRKLTAAAAGGDVDAIVKTFDTLRAKALQKSKKSFLPNQEIEKLWKQAVEYHGVDLGGTYFEVEKAVMAQFGRLNTLPGTTLEISDKDSKVAKTAKMASDIATTHTILTTLLFAVPASLPDVGGIMARSKEARNFATVWKNLTEGDSREESMALARAIGAVTNDEVANQFMSEGEMDHLGKRFRWATDKFFKYTGTTGYTRMMRRIAAGVGKEFLVHNAMHPEFDSDPRRKRYLDELGVTREQVQAWADTKFAHEGPEFDAVKGAIARFVDESIVRPDAAQRPIWASNPWFQVLWVLKSYFYAYGKAVLGGIGREIKNRYHETGDFTAPALTMLLAAGFIVPLAMMGLGAREWMKYAGRLVVPGLEANGKVFQSRYMEGGDYVVEIIDRSGILGPLTLVKGTFDGISREGLGGPVIGNVPAVDAVDDSVFDGDWWRLVPVANNL